jgi:hypothetical protein
MLLAGAGQGLGAPDAATVDGHTHNTLFMPACTPAHPLTPSHALARTQLQLQLQHCLQALGKDSSRQMRRLVDKFGARCRRQAFIKELTFRSLDQANLNLVSDT